MTLLRAFALAVAILAVAMVACLAIAGRAVVADAHARYTILYLLIFLLPCLMALLKGGR